MKYILILSITILGLFGCTSYKFASLYQLKRGMTYDNATAILTDEHYNGMELISSLKDDTHTIKKGEDTYKVLFMIKKYRRQTSNHESLYMFAFQNDKLLYWGFPYEFNLSHDSKYNSIGEGATEVAKQKYKEMFEYD